MKSRQALLAPNAPLIWTTAFVLLLLVILLRTTGIHIDENNYWHLAATSATADPRATAKPPLFYALNYLAYNGVGKHMGWLSPVSLLIFYAAVLSTALTLFVSAATPRARVPLLALLLTSPFVLYNGTQLMMELPVISCLLFSLAFYLRLHDRYTRGGLAGLACSMTLAFSFKMTAVFAALGLGASTKNRSVRVALGFSVVAGVLLVKLHLWLLHPVASIQFAGWGELREWGTWSKRLGWTASHFWTALFFLGPPLLGLIPVFYRQRSLLKERSDQVRQGLYWGALTLPLVFVTQVSSNFDFVRYTYPTLLIGLSGFSLVLATLGPRIVPWVVGLQLLLGLPLIRSSPDRFWAWPESIVREHFRSGGTRLRDIPLWSLVLRTRLQDPAPCIWTNSTDTEQHGLTTQFFKFAFPQAILLEESDPAPQCVSHARIVSQVWHRPERVTELCHSPCEVHPGSRFAHCGIQPIRWFQEHPGDTAALDCWAW